MSAFFELGIDKSLANSIAEAIAGKKPLKTLQEQKSQIILSEKTDPVDPKEAKKKFKDREDKDLDNDGDSDESDRYLHKRRKAIQKNMKGSKDELDMEPKAKDDGNMSESNLEEADKYHRHMLKALGKSRLPKNHAYRSEVSKETGDFIVRDGGGRVVGRLKKGEHSLGEEMRTNSSETSAKGAGYLHKKKLADGNHFVVGYNPNYRGQKGVDKHIMKVVDGKNTTVKHFGTHPSLEGAKKFGDNSLHKYYKGVQKETTEFGITIKLGDKTEIVSEEFWFSDESRNLRKKGWRKV